MTISFDIAGQAWENSGPCPTPGRCELNPCNGGCKVRVPVLDKRPCCGRSHAEMHAPDCPVAVQAVAKAHADRDERVRERTIAAFTALGPPTIPEGTPRPAESPRQAVGEVSYMHAGQLVLSILPGCMPETLRRARAFLDALIEDLAK